MVGSAIPADGCFEWVVMTSVCFWVANFVCLFVCVNNAGSSGFDLTVVWCLFLWVCGCWICVGQ